MKKDRKKEKFNLNRMLSYLAILVSAGTFFTFIYQTHLIQKHQYASVLPYLELWNTEVDNTYSLSLKNNGIGPAFISEINIHYSDSIYNLDPAQFVNKYLADSLSINYTYSNLRTGNIIPAGSEVKLLVSDSSANSNKWLRYIFNEEAKLNIIYSSVYEEQWILEGIGRSAKKLD